MFWNEGLPGLGWVALKELKFSYHDSEAISFTIYPYCGFLNRNSEGWGLAWLSTARCGANLSWNVAWARVVHVKNRGAASRAV